METTVLCLANSKKEGERCIAGIDVRTSQWVRPVSRHTPKGEVPFRERQVNGQEPKLLDLIQMDLAHQGPTGFDYCHAEENRWIEPTAWTKIGAAGVGDLHRYLCSSSRILHSPAKYTRPDVIESKPLMERTTLELRKVQLGLPRFRGQVDRSHAMTLRLFNDDQPDQDQAPVHGAAKS